MVFCPKCGKGNPDESTYCNSCGNALPKTVNTSNSFTQSQTGPQPYVTSPPSAVPRKSHAGRNIGIGLIVLIGIIVIVVIASANFASNNGNGGNSLFGPTSHTINVASGSTAVNARTYTGYSFSVPSDASNPVLQGSFTASGGSGNDIKVYVMDQTDYVNWENNHQAYTNYNSGQVTTGNINISLSAGTTYNIVFDNSFSLLSSKTVSAQIDLTYTS